MASRIVDWWRWNVLVYWYLLGAGWRLITGRFFILRDAPDWLVEGVAEVDADTDNDIVKGIVAEARNEWRLRIRQKERENEQAEETC